MSAARTPLEGYTGFLYIFSYAIFSDAAPRAGQGPREGLGDDP